MVKLAVHVTEDEHGEKFDCGQHGNAFSRVLRAGETALVCYDCRVAERQQKAASVGFHGRRRYRCNADGVVVEETLALLPPTPTRPAVPCVVVLG